MLIISKNKNFIKVFFQDRLVFTQVILISPSPDVSNYTFTLMYIFKILVRFGLSKPLKK